MIIGIKIMPREVILDTQGRVVENYLKSNGFEITACRIGKFIEIDLDADINTKNRSVVENKVHQMMLAGLYNPLIEKYEITGG
jgi:phosphoribosylformylglycinamidine synthase PurS subunit